MRKRKLPPDIRPDWRDPNLPLWHNTLGWIKPERMQRAAQAAISNPFIPHYTRDPTYNLRKDRR